MSMHVIFPGPCTTIQDGGRPGYQNSGFAPSGFIDRIASRMANALVDNDDAEAVLEFCLMGPTLTFDEDMRADRQTTGGYAKIAAIITLDIPRFAQLRPGQKVQFEQIGTVDIKDE